MPRYELSSRRSSSPGDRIVIKDKDGSHFSPLSPPLSRQHGFTRNDDSALTPTPDRGRRKNRSFTEPAVGSLGISRLRMASVATTCSSVSTISRGDDDDGDNNDEESPPSPAAKVLNGSNSSSNNSNDKNDLHGNKAEAPNVIVLDSNSNGNDKKSYKNFLPGQPALTSIYHGKDGGPLDPEQRRRWKMAPASSTCRFKPAKNAVFLSTSSIKKFEKGEQEKEGQEGDEIKHQQQQQQLPSCAACGKEASPLRGIPTRKGKREWWAVACPDRCTDFEVKIQMNLDPRETWWRGRV